MEAQKIGFSVDEGADSKRADAVYEGVTFQKAPQPIHDVRRSVVGFSEAATKGFPAIGVENGAVRSGPIRTYDNETSHPAGELYGCGSYSQIQKG